MRVRDLLRGSRDAASADWLAGASDRELATVIDLTKRIKAGDPTASAALSRIEDRLRRRAALGGPPPKERSTTGSRRFRLPGGLTLLLGFDPTAKATPETERMLPRNVTDAEVAARAAEYGRPLPPPRPIPAPSVPATPNPQSDEPRDPERTRSGDLLPRSGTTGPATAKPLTGREWRSQKSRSAWSLSRGVEEQQF